MRILYITRILPYPADSGGKIKTLSTLRLLAKKYDIDLVTFYQEEKSYHQAKKYFLGLGIKLDGIHSNKGLNYHQPRSTILKNFLLFKPAFFTSIYSGKLKNLIDQLIRQNKYDRIHIDHLAMAQYLPQDKTCKWLYEEHNIEYLLAWEEFRYTKKIFFFFEAILLWFYEKYYINKFDKILCISNHDKNILLGFTRKAKLIVLPPAASIYEPTTIRQLKSLLFVGNFLWHPNIDALQWFCKNILTDMPDVQLEVIGEINENTKRQLSIFKNCIIKGYIKNLDVYLKHKAYIFVLPIRIAQGVRLKALDAMARGYPIISTRKGMLGLKVQPDIHFLKADNAEEFKFQIKKLQTNTNLAQKLRKAGYTYLNQHHSEKVCSKILSQI